MEPLWSPVVGTGGNQWQTGWARKPRKLAKTVAVGCDRLPEMFHGKEGVDGSSPSEGSCKSLQRRGFHLLSSLDPSNVLGYGTRLEHPDQKGAIKAPTLRSL